MSPAQASAVRLLDSSPIPIRLDGEHQTDTVPVVDRSGRPLRDLRVSVTDRCNLRCAYCMPEEHYEWLPSGSFLSCDELARVIGAFADAGVTKVRLTGGEPLLRRDLTELVARIASIPAITDLALTTNGTHLAEHAERLRTAGLGRVTISLDTLRADRHHRLTRRDNHGAVLAGIEATIAAGFENTKINAVVMRGVNDDELVDLIRFGTEHRAEVRFIEYMDVGGATRWNPAAVVDAAEILERVGRELGRPEPTPSAPSAPARRFTTPGGHCFGIVASTSTPFCSSCDRSRLTADGIWYHCLYAAEGIDLASVARRRAVADGAAEVGTLTDMIRSAWERRADQGAVDRLAMDDRAPTPVRILRADPHREMHTRGG